MNNKTNTSPLSIAFMLLLIVALIAGMFLVNQNQETRRGAYFAGAKVMVLPAVNTAKVGDNVPVQLWVETDTGARVSAVDTKICYGDKVKLDATDITSLITLNQDAFKVIEYTKVENNCLRLVVVSSGIAPENLKSGLVKVASIRFKAVTAGTGNFGLNLLDAEVDGYNPAAGATDTTMKVSTVTGASYTITSAGGVTPSPTGTSDPAPILKFKMSFYGIGPAAACADAANMPLSITVRANNGTAKTYDNVIAVRENNTDALSFYNVELPLTGFNIKNNLAVFVKSKKSLQVKYGVNNQDGYYGKAGGELVGLTSDRNNTAVFHFEKYPLLAGDVTGPTDSAQDGVVDGLDFSFVKTESIKRTEVAAGGFMLADLNGNCKMESQDLSNLMLSLSVKQGQLY